jgi:hypothetical protein
MFASNSRYYGLATYQVTTSDGKSRIAVVPAVPNPLQLAGFHRRITGDRLDLIAARFLKDPTRFWQLCDSNNSPTPDALAAADLIGVPNSPGTQ